MTLGEQRVRTRFNPSNDSIVDQIKQETARLIDTLNDQRFSGGMFISGSDEEAEFHERNRLLSLAQTSYEEAAMWAVKAIT